MVFFALCVSVVLVGIDRLTKWLVIVYISPVQPVPTIPVLEIGGVKLVYFTYCENTGAAFSILSGHRVILTVISLVFVAGAVAVLFSGKIKSKTMIWSIALIVAGGVGNLIDRISSGYVVDFIDLKFSGFAIFNFADICAVTGAFMLFLTVLRDEIRDFKARRACLPEDDGEEISVKRNE
ncbi:MAG: signal peptidase II [Oscillospiraceae bacterium]|jgi:signal peptidase II|nr:signal peptidase II [Oscillospiraceae bacterium]